MHMYRVHKHTQIMSFSRLPRLDMHMASEQARLVIHGLLAM